jgi:outer membrane receptor protein involved in Fe transport
VAPQIGLDEQIVTNASETVFDAQISYEFPETSTLAGLKLLAQANNFTDEPTRSFFGVSSQTGTIQRFGRTFFLGATYQF